MVPCVLFQPKTATPGEDRAAAEALVSSLDSKIQADIEALGPLVAAAARTAAAAELPAEPDLPVSRGRWSPSR